MKEKGRHAAFCRVDSPFYKKRGKKVEAMIEIKTPDRFLLEWWKKIPAAVKTAFFAAILFGLMTHLYQFTNKLYNYDELAITPAGYGIGAEAGRWFLQLFGGYTASWFGNYSLPLLNGLMSLFLVAVSAALVADAFHVKSRIFAAAIGGLMAVFTPVVCMFYFMYAAPFYSLAIFFSVLSSYLVLKYPKKLLPHLIAVVLLACSLGTYQAYYANAACMFVMHLILVSAFSDEGTTVKEIVLTGVRYLAVLAAALIAYLLLHKFFLALWDVQMVNYQGMDSMGQMTAEQLLGALKNCFWSMKQLAAGHIMSLSPTRLFHRAFKLVYLIFGVSIVGVLFLKKGAWIKKVFVLFGFAIFPVALFLIYPMSPGAWAYTLMGYAAVFLPVFLVIWVEKFCENITFRQSVTALVQWVTALLTISMVLLYVWYGNGCYMALEYTKYHDLAYYQTMVTQIKSLEGYTDEMPVAIIGNEISDATNNMGSMVGGTFGLDGRTESNINAYSRNSIITKYLGFAPRFCSYEEIVELMKEEVVREMPCYPDEGAIQIVDGVVVIKLTEYE